MNDVLDAKASAAIARNLMAGFPPEPGQTVRFADASSRGFPNHRWSFSHQRELGPSAVVRRGPGAASALPRALRDDLDAVPFTTLDGQAMTWGESIDANYTDGLVVLHRGAVVYETYRGVLEPHMPHHAMSVTKSFVGLVAAMLVHEGVLDPDATVPTWLPEMAGTAYGDATLRHVLDMTTGVRYSEVYTDPKAEVATYASAAGLRAPPPGYAGPDTIVGFLLTLMKEGAHGEAFAYKTCNSEVLSWIIQRATGKPLAQQLSERIWQKLGAEEDAYVMVDRIGMAIGGAALNTTLRDLARVGEMMRCGGAFNGQQVVPAAVVADIANGANREHFARAGYVTLPGWSYRNQWWVSHNRFGAYSARGIHGQACYVAPGAEMVIARYASHPTAANGNGPLDRVSLPAFEALAAHLQRG